jgi:Lecithin retinol acyltransferase
MARGDHIYVHRLGYTHHGINCGDGTVIHYTDEVGQKSNAESFFVGSEVLNSASRSSLLLVLPVQSFALRLRVELRATLTFADFRDTLREDYSSPQSISVARHFPGLPQGLPSYLVHQTHVMEA